MTQKRHGQLKVDLEKHLHVGEANDFWAGVGHVGKDVDENDEDFRIPRPREAEGPLITPTLYRPLLQDRLRRDRKPHKLVEISSHHWVLRLRDDIPDLTLDESRAVRNAPFQDDVHADISRGAEL